MAIKIDYIALTNRSSEEQMSQDTNRELISDELKKALAARERLRLESKVGKKPTPTQRLALLSSYTADLEKVLVDLLTEGCCQDEIRSRAMELISTVYWPEEVKVFDLLQRSEALLKAYRSAYNEAASFLRANNLAFPEVKKDG